MSKKTRSKGYMLVEIILAFVITFAISYFIVLLVIKLKNRNDDLMVTNLTSTDQTIISNKLSTIIKEKGQDFDCEKLIINGQTISYEKNVIDTINDYATYSLPTEKEKWCYVSSEKNYVKINIPITVKQQPDNHYDVNLYQEISVAEKGFITCEDIINSGYKCKNAKSGDIEPYTFTYTGNCTYIDDGDGNCRIKFTSSGNLTINYGMQVDVFLVGGGGGGHITYDHVGGAGGGGYTKTVKNVTLESNTYKVNIGGGGKGGKYVAGSSGGQSSIKLNNVIINDLYAAGGKPGAEPKQGCCGKCSWGGEGGNGGGGWSDCNLGTPFTPGRYGKYQERTTCEFDQGTTSKCDPGVKDYAEGGCCGCCYVPKSGGGSCDGGNGTANTGSGGGASYNNGSAGNGGSGIIIIRNVREQ